jgi:hypothetical protein
LYTLSIVGILAVSTASVLFKPQHTINIPTTNINLTAKLGPQLSHNAAIFVPDHVNWANASARWQGYAIPTYQSVVEVASEQDIQRTVSGAMKW